MKREMKWTGIMLVLWVLLVGVMSGCASMATPKTLGDQLVYAGHTVAAIKTQAAGMLQRGRISVEDAENIQQRTNEAQSVLNMAWVARGSGDLDAATAALTQAQAIIFELEKLYPLEEQK